MKKNRAWYIIAGIMAAAFLVLQFMGADRENPVTPESHAITAATTIPGPVRRALDAACMDCHSHKTDWPWFSAVAPVSWVVADNVRKGREHLNFSAWSARTPAERRDAFLKISEVVRNDRMPPTLYQWTHSEARLTTADRFMLYFWARNEVSRIKAEASETASADARSR